MKLTTSISVICFLSQIATARSETPGTYWYYGHFGSETCIALDNTDIATGTRLYYHAGTIHSPQQLMSFYQRNGDSVSVVHDKDGMLIFTTTDRNGEHTNIAVFNSYDTCKFMMDKMKEN